MDTVNDKKKKIFYNSRGKNHLKTVSLGSQSRCLLRKPVCTSASASARTMAMAESIGNRNLLEIKDGSFGNCKLCSLNNMNSVLSGYFWHFIGQSLIYTTAKLYLKTSDNSDSELKRVYVSFSVSKKKPEKLVSLCKEIELKKKEKLEIHIEFLSRKEIYRKNNTGEQTSC